MDGLKLLTDMWPVLLTSVGVIVWLVRLEGRVNQNRDGIQRADTRIDILTARCDLHESKTFEQLAQVRESLARIEGALGVKPSA